MIVERVQLAVLIERITSPQRCTFQDPGLRVVVKVKRDSFQ
jgi:hypothetical protein